MNIWIVEDNPIDAAALCDVLGRADFHPLEIQQYASLEELPDDAHEADVDVVLLDLILGDTSGVDTVLGARTRLPHVPLVVMTADADEERAFEMLRNGAEDYLVKGAYSVDTLRRAIRYAIERYSLRASLLRADRLAVVGQLAAGVAHEVSNPASFVLGNAVALGQLLEELKQRFGDDVSERFDSTSARMETLIGEILGGIERISNVVRELQDYSRLTDGQIRKVNINDVISEASKLVQNSLRHRAQLILELEPLPLIAADPFKIEQVLTNLLVNATHAFGDRPMEQNEIRVETSTVRDASAHDKQSVVVLVSDNGCGIEPGQLAHIFKPFYTTKSRRKGTGLGLSMSAEIVRMHGGAIRCESIVGQGTRFLVELPVTQDLPPSAAPPSALPAPRPPARARVLLVDDEPLVLDFFRTVVESKHDAVALGNAEDALRLLEDDRRFDLIVCDFTMPGMSGPEFKRRTAEMDPDLAQRFIFCTGGALTEDAQLISRTNKEVLLFKPIKPDKLLFAIDKRIAELRRS